MPTERSVPIEWSVHELEERVCELCAECDQRPASKLVVLRFDVSSGSISADVSFMVCDRHSYDPFTQ